MGRGAYREWLVASMFPPEPDRLGRVLFCNRNPAWKQSIRWIAGLSETDIWRSSMAPWPTLTW